MTTYKGKVFVVDQEFHIPHLNRKRKVWMYLPPDYEHTDKRYPVIYMQDGQNLFDEKASFAGEWYVDETLDHLFHHHGDQGAIVVGVENAKEGTQRLSEYSPWFNAYNNYGGDGEHYVNFIIHTLKPYIDEHFRTFPERENTAIMGSSMGGLITLYAVIQYQEVFGKAGIFSPSLWFSESAFTHIDQVRKRCNVKLYLVAGEKEGAYVSNGLRRLYYTLLQTGFNNNEINMEIAWDGTHQEWFWAREFPKAYQWLMAS
ncbi:MAG: alpha/beta hydrolase [Saprospiraceae bacterium]|nr:alpha/beta hydrolase [Saprospiraceae bacterium]